jgi:hypothetical protein
MNCTLKTLWATKSRFTRYVEKKTERERERIGLPFFITKSESETPSVNFICSNSILSYSVVYSHRKNIVSYSYLRFPT